MAWEAHKWGRERPVSREVVGEAHCAEACLFRMTATFKCPNICPKIILSVPGRVLLDDINI